MAGMRGVELPGLGEEFLRPLVVAFGVRGPGVEDQPPGGDLIPVLLPQPGAGRVERGGLVGELPGTVQVSCLVRLVGGYGRAVGLGAGAVLLGRSWWSRRPAARAGR